MCSFPLVKYLLGLVEFNHHFRQLSNLGASDSAEGNHQEGIVGSKLPFPRESIAATLRNQNSKQPVLTEQKEINPRNQGDDKIIGPRFSLLK